MDNVVLKNYRIMMPLEISKHYQNIGLFSQLCDRAGMTHKKIGRYTECNGLF
ncbi:hypothetical protein [Psychromonas sp. CNPT3]|uniref:hypothetical protein n=1 Tax=Psychromonas sp. CNPT3 TaxID=314282 RepID=UPI00006E48C2|nr:hypothetical protein [Psychromonas sp. CNPT3]